MTAYEIVMVVFTALDLIFTAIGILIAIYKCLKKK